jgi:hypothetical protein
MATIAAVAAIGAAAYGASASNKSAKKQQSNLKEQMKEARRIRRENNALSDKGFTDINNLITGVGSLTDYLEEGEDIGQNMLDFRMDYVLGDTEGDLRESQRVNSNLAAFDFTDTNNSISKILKSNFYDIASITRDMPTGSFANMSVANIAGLTQQGLTNTIGIGDYISRVSGIDQYTPYRVAQDLFTIKRDEASQRAQAVNNNVSQKIGVNNQWFSNFSDISNASNVVEATRNAATIQAVNSAAGAIGGYATGMDTSKMQGQANNYYSGLIGKYGAAG